MNLWSKFCSTTTVCLLCLVCGPLCVQANDLNQEVLQLKQQLVEVRKELKELTNTVKELSTAVNASTPGAQADPRKRLDQAGKKGLMKPEVRSAVCKAVDAYIRESEECLRLNDGGLAESRMERAYSGLKEAVDRYSDLPTVSEILNVAAGLDFNTYSDVSLRDSSEGTRGIRQGSIACHYEAILRGK